MSTDPPGRRHDSIGMGEAVHLATHNAAGLWTALAATRGHQVTRRPGFLAVDGRPRTALRIVLLRPQSST